MKNLSWVVRLEKKEDKEYEPREDIERKRMNYTYGYIFWVTIGCS